MKKIDKYLEHHKVAMEIIYLDKECFYVRDYNT